MHITIFNIATHKKQLLKLRDQTCKNIYDIERLASWLFLQSKKDIEWLIYSSRLHSLIRTQKGIYTPWNSHKTPDMYLTQYLERG